MRTRKRLWVRRKRVIFVLAFRAVSSRPTGFRITGAYQ